MTEQEQGRLARIEEKIDNLTDLVCELRASGKDHESRITLLEAATKDAIPQVWKNRDRIAVLEAVQKHGSQTGNRWWEVLKMALSPAIAAAVGWLLGRKG